MAMVVSNPRWLIFMPFSSKKFVSDFDQFEFLKEEENVK